MGSHGHFHPEGQMVTITTQVLKLSVHLEPSSQLVYATIPPPHIKGSQFDNINPHKALPKQS